MTTYRILATNEKTREVFIHDFDTALAQIGARRELYSTGLYSSLQTLDNEQGEWLVDQTFHYGAQQLKEVRALAKRIADEKKAVKKIVESAIRLGYMISLWDGEEFSVKRSTDKALILANIYATDMDRLDFRVKATGEQVGSVLLVYGNSASEVMCDWADTDDVNAILVDAKAFCDKLSEKGL